VPARTLWPQRDDEEPGAMVAAPALPLRTRILLAEDHGLVRAGLRLLLESRPALEVVGEAADGEEAVAQAALLLPDLVLMDLAMPSLGGLDATRRILAAGRGIRVLVVSQLSSESAVEEALRAGAHGYLSKGASAGELLQAVEVVSAGGSYFRAATGMRFGHPCEILPGGEPTTAALSPREREILTRLAEGLSSREIARSLHVSPRTVDTHRVRLMKKLGLHKAPQLVRFAIRAGLLEP
jgi:DNA-binding NarL/FixJ family response regulator